MNDPAWDLAYFSVEADFDRGSDGELLAAYFGRPPDAGETARMEVYKALCEMLSALWALVQAAQRQPRRRLPELCGERHSQRSGQRMRSAEFATHVDALRAG